MVMVLPLFPDAGCNTQDRDTGILALRLSARVVVKIHRAGVDHPGMASAPGLDPLREPAPAVSPWLGSAARRGDAQAHGKGWEGNQREDADKPHWLGSVGRREGSQTGGAGWVDPEQAERPRWVGSIARRGDQTQATEKVKPDDGSVHSLYLVDLESENEATGSEQAERESSADWQGSGGRARLNEVREAVPELFEPEDELGERRTRYVVGELGMSLRVVA
jgi:hypothetical protein